MQWIMPHIYLTDDYMFEVKFPDAGIFMKFGSLEEAKEYRKGIWELFELPLPPLKK